MKNITWFKNIKKLLLHFIVLLLSNAYWCQCNQIIQLNNWTAEGGSANWVVNTAGTSVTQTINGLPAFFVSPQEFINVEIKGKFTVPSSADNDFLGFVLGYQGPFDQSTMNDYYLFSTVEDEIIGHSTACENFFGYVNGPAANLDLWAYNASGGASITSLMCNDVFPGWELGRSYNFVCRYTSRNITILIDNFVILDIDGCFPAGRIGFYNYSQDNVVYSNFSYSTIADFEILNDSICLGTDMDVELFCDPIAANPYSTMNWDMGDGSLYLNTGSISHSYKKAGVYNVTLDVIDAFGCPGKMVKQVTVFDPNLDLGPDISTCNNVMPTVKVVSSADFPSSYLWNTMAVTDDITVTQSGTYYLDVIDVNGCTDSDTIQVDIIQSPTAAFASLDVCDEDNYVFTDASTANGGTLNFWNWDFESDASVDAIVQNTTYLYPESGDHDVTLIVGNDLGCFDTLREQITVLDLPIATFDFTYVCEGQSTLFIDQSTTTHGSIQNWNWDFTNDGVVDDNVQNTNYQYGASGADSVHLSITTSSNCTADATIEVSVNALPIANFSWVNVCEGQEMIFTDLSSLDYGNVVSRNWNFGDGINGNSLGDTNYTYASSGIYNVNLKITSDSGCKDSRMYPVRVFDLPNADFTFSDVCDQEAVFFTNSSTDNGTVINGFDWDYTGDEIVDYSGINGSYTFPSPSSYPVMLVASTTDGCKDTIFQNVTVFPNPTVLISGSDVCQDVPVILDNTSVISGGTITDWNWNFDNGNGSILQNPTEVFNSEGVYSIELIATSNQGCTSVGNTSLIVYPLPVAQFVFADVCDEDSVSFADFSIVSSPVTSNSIVNWDWDFGDVPAGIAQGQFVNYLYPDAGVYPVTLSVETNNGCVSSSQQNVTVHPNPIVNFTSLNSSGCSELCVDFINNTSISGGLIPSYFWNFGNGNANISESPTECYRNTSLIDDMYTVELTATSDMGCSVTSVEPDFVTVFSIAIADFDASSFAVTTYDTEIEFTNESQNSDTYFWDFAGLDVSMDADNIYTFPEEDSATYNVCLDVESINGCMDDTCKIISVSSVSSLFVPNAFSPNDDGVNDLFQPSLYGFSERDFSFQIFDRWGTLVYEANTILDTYWDGLYKGIPAPAGNYVWKIYGVDKYTLREVKRMGHVVIIR